MDVGLVCDACSALTPIGVPQCTRCGSAVALDPRAAKKSQPPPAANRAPATMQSTAAPCPKCGDLVTGGLKFCPSCGQRIVVEHMFDVETKVGPVAKAGHRPTMMFGGVMQQARAKLTLIRGDGEDSVSFTLAGTDHLAGRGDCPIAFPDDTFLSPTHANFTYRDGKLVVVDEDSLNGVFVRIHGGLEIAVGTTILVGEQVLVVKLAPTPEDLPDAEGTYFSASMVRPASLEVHQHLRGGVAGWVFRLNTDVITIGREANDINFPEDPFISGRHAELKLDSSGSAAVLSVTDLGSRNGTFVRITGEQVLKHGDYVFLGQQLLRVEIV
ncbi:MAG: FHA domain-containing protein [Proteobacteria bacterium]|nr:FHA domain-containing protein [Pseudomonadota bacterium]